MSLPWFLTWSRPELEKEKRNPEHQLANTDKGNSDTGEEALLAKVNKSDITNPALP